MTPAGISNRTNSAAGAWPVQPGAGRHASRTCTSECGVSALEVLLALAMSVTMTALAMALASSAIDEMRTAVGRALCRRADRIGADRCGQARAAPWRSGSRPSDGDYHVRALRGRQRQRCAHGRDSRGDRSAAGAVRAAGATSSPACGSSWRRTPRTPTAQAGTGADGVRIGSARLLTMSADGTATSGTLYVRGRKGQYAVRVLGVTGRTRMLQYSAGNRTWLSR